MTTAVSVSASTAAPRSGWIPRALVTAGTSDVIEEIERSPARSALPQRLAGRRPEPRQLTVSAELNCGHRTQSVRATGPAATGVWRRAAGRRHAVDGEPRRSSSLIQLVVHAGRSTVITSTREKPCVATACARRPRWRPMAEQPLHVGVMVTSTVPSSVTAELGGEPVAGRLWQQGDQLRFETVVPQHLSHRVDSDGEDRAGVRCHRLHRTDEQRLVALDERVGRARGQRGHGAPRLVAVAARRGPQQLASEPRTERSVGQGWVGPPRPRLITLGG